MQTTTICEHCGQVWSILHDGTVVEHPLPESPFLLCSGSRTKIGPRTLGVETPLRNSASRKPRRRLVAALSHSG
jgi:hypothetical protein